MLPGKLVYNKYCDAESIHQAIKTMVVRGAPAIGITAAYGLYLAIRDYKGDIKEDFIKTFEAKADYLATARPTAVNLFWALDRMKHLVYRHQNEPVEKVIALLLEEAIRIHREDGEINRSIGENLLKLLKDGMGILTHCNAGILATSKYGTATAPLYLAHEKGWKLKVFADETRPRLQGASLTAFELKEAGIDVTLITDNMAAHVMSQGRVNAVIVGTDRVAANGDVANKIGTLALSIIAVYYGIPFYVAAPTSSIDMSLSSGDIIPIEERDIREVTEPLGIAAAPPHCKAYNPAFDITPAKNITAIVTEKGIIRPPYLNSLKQMMNR
jgi:methylthioribose-1-phosphate isomerase